jgi:chorismate mutase
MRILPIFEDEKRPILIAGPCSAETEEQVMETAAQLAAEGGVDAFRAGIWKPRTRPGSFEGVGATGLKWLQQVKKEYGFKITTEVANHAQVFDALKAGVDILWIGARTTVNPFSVQEVADALKGVDIPVMIKNPINPDLELWIGAIERIHNAGITRIAAIHRGFSSHRKSEYRNNPMWEYPIELMRRFPELQMINDPSHICGNRHMLQGVAQKAMDLNFDGVIMETHRDPDNAWSDAKQQVIPARLKEIIYNLVVREEKSSDIIATQTLENLRSQINDLDAELLTLLGNRMKIADKIGEFKRDNNISILQTTRWAEILEQSIANGKSLGLSEGFVMSVLSAIHQESINHQAKIMNEAGTLTL